MDSTKNTIVREVWYFSESIKLDREKMLKLKQLIEKNYEIQTCSADLIDGRRLDFPNFDKVLEYENHNNERITSLRIEGHGEDYKEKAFILQLRSKFDSEKNYSYNFNETVEMNYRLPSLQESNTLRDDFFKWADSCKTNYYKLAKMCVLQLMFKLNNYLLFFWLVIIGAIYISGETLSQSSLDIYSGALLISLVVLVCKILDYLDEKISKLLFVPIVFYWGEEIKREDKRDKLRSNIFWVIVMGIIISVVGAFIYAGLTNGG